MLGLPVVFLNILQRGKSLYTTDLSLFCFFFILFKEKLATTLHKHLSMELGFVRLAGQKYLNAASIVLGVSATISMFT